MRMDSLGSLLFNSVKMETINKNNELYNKLFRISNCVDFVFWLKFAFSSKNRKKNILRYSTWNHKILSWYELSAGKWKDCISLRTKKNFVLVCDGINRLVTFLFCLMIELEGKKRCYLQNERYSIFLWRHRFAVAMIFRINFLHAPRICRF